MSAQSGCVCRPRGKLSVHTCLLYVISLLFMLSATACSPLRGGGDVQSGQLFPIRIVARIPPHARGLRPPPSGY